MVRNDRARKGGKVTPPDPDRHARQAVDRKWEALVMEILASPGNRPQDLDEVAAARYLSGQCPDEERKHLQKTIAGCPSLTDNLALARQVLQDMEPAA